MFVFYLQTIFELRHQRERDRESTKRDWREWDRAHAVALSPDTPSSSGSNHHLRSHCLDHAKITPRSRRPLNRAKVAPSRSQRQVRACEIAPSSSGSDHHLRSRRPLDLDVLLWFFFFFFAVVVVWVAVIWWFLCCVVVGFVWIVVDFLWVLVCGCWWIFYGCWCVGGGGFCDIKYVWKLRKWLRKCENL